MMMGSNKLMAAVLLVAVFGQSANSFVASPSQQHLGRNLSLRMAVSQPPPPQQQQPPLERVVAQAPSSSVTTAAAATTSNLPSQKDLAAKSASTISASSASASTSSPATKSTAGVSITDIRYDGAVPKTEADEYVVITNNSQSPIDISGYYVYVATTGTQGPTFTFPQGTTLNKGQSVRVYTNEIHKESGGYTFGSGKAIWNNNGGLGVLKDSTGKKLGEYKYTPNK